MSKWKLFATSGRYFYWVDETGHYNCTKENIAPSPNAGGYGDITYLMHVKGDTLENRDLRKAFK